MQLLSIESDAKTIKGKSAGYLTGILYLAPANESGVMNTCAYASAGCRAGCLFTAGRAAIFPRIIAARIEKTRFLARDREAFLEQLRREIRGLVRRASRRGLRPAVRLNGTSDLAWLPLRLCAEFPGVRFYDYTNLPKPWLRVRSNYHLTFSASESNLADVFAALEHKVNVSVVFSTRKGQALPKMWNGYRVVDGDRHDLRFLDGMRGLVIGLRAKGKAKKDTSGFVQIALAA